MILLPEIAFDQMKFLAKVQHWVETQGYCVIVASEGIRYPNGVFVSSSRSTDAFGHTQLGGVAPDLAKLVKHHLGYKYHWSAPDYLQRSARHLASALDVEQAYSVGQAAVEFALEGKNAVMPTIIRCADQQDYAWQVGEIPLAEVANKERKMPRDFISKDGFGINAAGRAYLQPLIVGESHPPYRQGIPHYACLKKVPVEKKLITDFQLT
jgi:6-phosphofructokinase 1